MSKPIDVVVPVHKINLIDSVKSLIVRWKWIAVFTTVVGIGMGYWILRSSRRRRPNTHTLNQEQVVPRTDFREPRNPEAEEEMEIKKILEDLESHSTEKHKSALNEILSFTNSKKLHKRLDKEHVPEKLIALFPNLAKDTDLLVVLLKSLCNLSASSEKPIRDNLANGIGDLINLLSTTNRDDVLEYTLRTLMNLAVDAENENRIRDEHGIPQIVSILKNQKTTDTVMLHTLRLLINLVFNELNREAIIKENGFERVVQLLEANANRSDIDNETKKQIVVRLARLLGFLSQTKDLNVELFKLAVTGKVAKIFVELIGNQNQKNDERELGYCMSSLLVIVNKANQTEYNSEVGPFVDELSKDLPKHIVPHTLSRNKNIQNLAAALLQSLFKANPELEDKIKEQQEGTAH